MNHTFSVNPFLLLKPGAILKGGKSGYIISKNATTVFFLLFSIVDILFSLSNNLIPEAVIITGIMLLRGLTVAGLTGKINRYLHPTNVFFITTAGLFAISILSGYSAGSYFYYFPAAMVYFVSTVNTNNNKRFTSFIIITLLFTTALMLHYFLSPRQNILPFGNTLLAYRFFVAIILTAVLIKNLFALQAHIQNSDSRKEYHEALFQSYLDAYIVFNHETREVTDYNKRMLSLFDIDPETDLKKLYITQVMMRYLSEDSTNKELIMDSIPDYWHGEAIFITHKKERFFSYVKSVVYHKDNIKYQILSIRDITSMKDAQKELMIYKESVEKAGRAKARFLSSMSHELRTPLNGIIGTSNLIKAECNLPPDIQKHIDVLLYSSENMLGIINDILDFSKIDAGKLELKKQSFGIKECINNLARSFENQFKHKNIQLIIDQSQQLEGVYVLSDEIKLSQVISNLLSNALKFTLEGNVQLIVKLKNNTTNKVTIHFEVRDTGIGIPKDKQAEIFQGFAQVHAAELSRRFGGTGLGLTISEKLVHIFGGKLQVESELERGSRFYFTIGFEHGIKIQPAVEKIVLPKNNIDIMGIKILIVEDNVINATILKSFLKKWEIQMKEAENGVHALELLKYHRFDLILMDLEMPEMDGYTAIKIIRQTDTTTPVLAFTASLLENMDAFLTEAGFNGFVLKPFRPAELKQKIEMYALQRKIAYV
jgi:CheY-like chemotaxis protein/nitrogen-specific signal transduction histidine kinase